MPCQKREGCEEREAFSMIAKKLAVHVESCFSRPDIGIAPQRASSSMIV